MVVERAKPTKPVRAPRKKHELSVWERLAKIGAAIPAKERARMPRDGARYFDHYFDGSPKED